MQVQTVQTREGYDAWSSAYDDYDNPLVALEEPVVSRLVGDPRQRRMADIGCGTGRHAIRLARAGAHVVGVDFSSGMLRALQRKPLPEGLTVLEHDLTTGVPFDDASFDLVLCCLVLEHMPDLDASIAELARICRPGGSVIITDLHPEMTRRGIQARYRDAQTGDKFQIAGGGHRPISAYVMAAVRAGLHIEHIEEHIMDEATAARSRSAQKYLNQPLLLTMKLTRRGRP